MSSIDDPAEKNAAPKKPTRKNAAPTTTRRAVVRRESKPLSRTGYSLASWLADIAEPVALVHRSKAAFLEWECGAKCIALARKVLPSFPSSEALCAAEMQISRALEKPLDEQDAGAMLALLLDGIGKRANEGAQSKIAAMLGVVADFGDPIAKSFELGGFDEEQLEAERSFGLDGEKPVSPVVLGLAVKQLFANQVFEPTPAELRKALAQAFRKIRAHGFRLSQMYGCRYDIDQLMFRDGNEEEKAAAGRALDYDEDLESNDEDLETSNSEGGTPS